MNKILLNNSIIDEITSKISSNSNDAYSYIQRVYRQQDPASELNLKIQLTILYCIAISLYKRDYTKAIQILYKTLLDHKNIQKDYLLNGKIYYRLGIFNHHIGNYLESFKNYNIAIESFRKIEPDNKEAELLSATCLQNLGILHRINNFEEFDSKNIEIAKKIYQKYNQYSGIASCYDLYAAYYGNLNKHQKANEYLIKSLNVTKKYGTIQTLAICYNNLATSYAELNQFDKAFEYHKESYKIRKKINNPYSIATHHMHLALTYQLHKEYKKAILHNKKAESFYEKYGYNSELLDIYKGLYLNYNILKNYKNANTYMLKYIEISKIVFKFDKASALYNAKLNFTLQEKEKEAHLLKEKNKEFESINEELKQFTYITSHDLKEPIRSLNNYVQLLIRSFKTDINPQQKEYLNYIELFSSRIFALIKDLNQYIQVQEPVEVGQVDLNKTIQVLKDNLSLLIKERNVVIKSSKLPEIKAPESHMHDLFLNLVQNAIKYNKSKTPKIKIDSFTSNKEIIISVNDNGIGIPKKNQVEIFEVFKRLHAKTDYEGTGIGLAICKKIVEQNNGRIWVESEENKGSTFFISFLKSKQK